MPRQLTGFALLLQVRDMLANPDAYASAAPAAGGGGGSAAAAKEAEVVKEVEEEEEEVTPCHLGQ